jgi:hypothetical protein
MRRIALTFIPLFLVACTSEPIGPNLAGLSGPQTAGALVSATGASTTQFDGFINFCHNAGLIGFTATPGGTLHFGVANENRWVTGNPLIDGLEHNTGDANINPFGQVVVRLQNSLKPDAVNGTWEIVQQLRIGDGVSTGVGHGTGALHGMTMKSTTDPTFIPTSVCNPDDLKSGVHGVILSPGS